MHLDEWLPIYEKIVMEFGFDIAEDARSADVLSELIGPRSDWTSIEGSIRKARIIVVGADIETPPPSDGIIIAADGAVTGLKELDMNPAIIVTDLDGIVEDQADLSSKGIPIVVHAHGDNMPALRRWVPSFTGPIAGTCQTKPVGPLRNYGGFTDGDRAVMIADSLGAVDIRLAGFRFDTPGRYSFDRDPEVKVRKLAWAERIISKASVNVEFI